LSFQTFCCCFIVLQNFQQIKIRKKQNWNQIAKEKKVTFFCLIDVHIVHSFLKFCYQ
jgi:hypothetical protein